MRADNKLIFPIFGSYLIGKKEVHLLERVSEITQQNYALVLVVWLVGNPNGYRSIPLLSTQLWW